VRIPLIARNLLQSIGLLYSAATLLAEKCVEGIEANEELCTRHVEATLVTATALNTHIGYDAAGEIVKEAAASGRTAREVAREKGVSEEILDEALDLRAMTRGGLPGKS
jgi:fumarate hydratase class II